MKVIIRKTHSYKTKKSQCNRCIVPLIITIPNDFDQPYLLTFYVECTRVYDFVCVPRVYKYIYIFFFFLYIIFFL